MPSPVCISIHRRSLDPVHSGVSGNPVDRSIGEPFNVKLNSEGTEIPEIEARIIPVGYFLSLDSEELKVISYGVSVRFCHLLVSVTRVTDVRIILYGHSSIFNPKVLGISEEFLPLDPLVEMFGVRSIRSRIGKTSYLALPRSFVDLLPSYSSPSSIRE